MKHALMKLLAGVALGAAAWLAWIPAAMAQAAAAAPVAEYRIGPGDVLRVVVYQNPDLQLETRVTDAGLVSYPLLGSLRVAGLTINELERLIADGLRNGNFVRQPQVTVGLLQVRAHQVSVLGQVNRPGRYPLETANMRLTEVLATAGGVAPSGSDVVVLSGQRAGKPYRAEIDVPTLFAVAGGEKDVPVQNGDIVWVDRQPIVYIYGEVQRPGPMRLEREMTLLQALATGGGLTLRGTEKGVRVHRKAADGGVTVLTPVMTDKLREGDVVFVRESLF